MVEASPEILDLHQFCHSKSLRIRDGLKRPVAKVGHEFIPFTLPSLSTLVGSLACRNRKEGTARLQCRMCDINYEMGINCELPNLVANKHPPMNSLSGNAEVICNRCWCSGWCTWE